MFFFFSPSLNWRMIFSLLNIGEASPRRQPSHQTGVARSSYVRIQQIGGGLVSIHSTAEDLVDRGHMIQIPACFLQKHICRHGQLGLDAQTLERATKDLVEGTKFPVFFVSVYSFCNFGCFQKGIFRPLRKKNNNKKPSCCSSCRHPATVTSHRAVFLSITASNPYPTACLNNSSAATPGPLGYCQHCCTPTHTQSRTQTTHSQTEAKKKGKRKLAGPL